MEKWDNRYSHNPHNLAQLPAARHRGGRSTFAEALLDILVACRCMLAPGGSWMRFSRKSAQRRRGCPAGIRRRGSDRKVWIEVWVIPAEGCRNPRVSAILWT